MRAFRTGMVDVERIKVDNRQTIDTLISEKAPLLTKFLRNERKDWIPMLVSVSLIFPMLRLRFNLNITESKLPVSAVLG